MIIQKRHIFFMLIVIVFSLGGFLFIKPVDKINNKVIENNISKIQINTIVNDSSSLMDYLEDINKIESNIYEEQEELKDKQILMVELKKDIDNLNKKLSKQKGESIYKNNNWYDIIGFYKNYSDKIKKVEDVEKEIILKGQSVKDLEKRIVELNNSIDFLSKQEDNSKNAIKQIRGLSNEQEEPSDIINVQKDILKENKTDIINSQLPSFIYPCKGIITSEFGYRVHPISGIETYHSGTDIGVDFGTPIKASNYGMVVFAGWYGGFGNCIILTHGNGLYTLYGHNAKLIVSVGDKIEQGQVIALAGSTGYSTGPHCHFSMWIDNKLVDPLKYLVDSSIS